MDQVTLVAEQIDDGMRLLEQLDKEGITVNAASWIKKPEEGPWYLYIATPIVDEGAHQAYRRVQSVIRKIPPPFWVDPFEVKLIDTRDPLVAGISDLYQDRNRKIPTRYRGASLGGESIDEAYIYPPEIPTTTTRRAKGSRKGR